jgi:hypothetical protein
MRHVGMDHLGNKLIIVFRELPDDPNSALVVFSNTLSEMYHDQLLRVVDSDDAQKEMDLYPVLTRRNFGDGAVMLNALHGKGLLKKIDVDQVKVVPMPNRSEELRTINNQIRKDQGKPVLAAKDENKGVEAAVAGATGEAPAPVVATPTADLPETERKTLAEGKLTQARLMEEDALRLREEAYLLDPSLKKGGRPKKFA